MAGSSRPQTGGRSPLVSHDRAYEDEDRRGTLEKIVGMTDLQIALNVDPKLIRDMASTILRLEAIANGQQ